VPISIEILASGDVKNIAQFSVFVRSVSEGFQLVSMLLVTSSLYMLHIKIFEEMGVQTEQEIKKKKAHKYINR